MSKKKKDVPEGTRSQEQDDYVSYRVKRYKSSLEDRLPNYVVDPRGFSGEKPKKKPVWAQILLSIGYTLGVLLLLILALMMVIPPIEEMIVRLQKTESVIGEQAVLHMESDEGYKPTDWMLAVDDATPLNLITIPGTHNSAARCAQLALFSKCQAYDISEQLNLGYRALDIRVGVKAQKDGSRKLILKHGFTNCLNDVWLWSGSVYLEDVVNDCNAFLTKHPTETILFIVKYEDGDESLSEIQTMLDSVVNQNRDRWLLTDTMPTLSEARGKIVLMRRYEDEAGLKENAGLAVDWDGQGREKQASDPYVLQPYDYNCSDFVAAEDYYEQDNDEKWRNFINALNLLAVNRETGVLASSKDVQNERIALIFLSSKGSMSYGHPYLHSMELNPKLEKLEFAKGYSYGWIFVDFGTENLAKLIYSNNFKANAITE